MKYQDIKDSNRGKYQSGTYCGYIYKYRLFISVPKIISKTIRGRKFEEVVSQEERFIDVITKESPGDYFELYRQTIGNTLGFNPERLRLMDHEVLKVTNKQRL